MDEPKNIAELEQRPGPFRRHHLTLYEDRLEIRVCGLLERYRIPFYLHMIKEEPDRVREIPWLWIVFGGAAFGLAFLLGITGRPAEVALGGLLASVALAVAVVQIPRMRRMYVYTYRPVGGDASRGRFEPHLYLLADRPSTGEVRRFVEQIGALQRRHIEKLKSEQEGDGGIAYARELERFTLLRERNVLSEHEYVQVKAKLLNLKPRRIGF